MSVSSSSAVCGNERILIIGSVARAMAAATRLRVIASASEVMIMYMALRSACVLLTALLLPGLGTLMAQSETNASDSRLEKLYADAKTDEAAGDLAGAIAKYKSILRVAPDVGPAYNNLGALYFKQRDYAKAAAVLQQGLKVDRNMVSASALLGMSLFQMGK